MASEDRERWDARYRRLTAPAEPRRPTALEQAGIVLPPTGAALDVACGAGSVSVWLAQQGLSVLGIDVSPVAVSTAVELARRFGVEELARFEVADLDAGIPVSLSAGPLSAGPLSAGPLSAGPLSAGPLSAGPVSAGPVSAGPVSAGPVFDLVVCQRFRVPAMYSSLAASVAPGGLLVITVLSTVGHIGDPGPFRAGPGELAEAFGEVSGEGFETLWSSEADGEAHLVARRP